MTERCELCRFFRPESSEFGRCQRHAPIIVPGKMAARFPLVYAIDWCGDYQAKEAGLAEGAE